jgi:hypothetical protein
MLFFSAVTTPAVFRTVPAASSGTFLRAVFPTYFLVNGALAAAAGLLAMHVIATPLLLLAAAAMLAVRFGAIPVINAARDAMVAGDQVAKRKFDAWHRGTVVVNLVEMSVLVTCIFVMQR